MNILLYPSKKKINKKQKVKIKDTSHSDFYNIHSSIVDNHTIPVNFERIRIRRISEDSQGEPIYRATIFIRKDGSGPGLKPQKGLYAGDKFLVFKTGVDEFIFEPPLGEPQVRKSI